MVALVSMALILACRPYTGYRALIEAVGRMEQQARVTSPAHCEPPWIVEPNDG